MKPKVKLEEEEGILRSELQNLELQDKQQDERIQQLKENVLRLETDEARYWEEVNLYEKKLHRLEEKQQQALSEKNVIGADLARISRINVINDVFHIGCDMQAGTINGLVVGKRSE